MGSESGRRLRSAKPIFGGSYPHPALFTFDGLQLFTECAFCKEWPASGHGKDIQVEPLLHIEVEGAVRTDVAPNERRQGPEVGRHHARHPARFGQHALQHQRVHVDQAGLQQVKRVHRDLLVLQPIAGHLATFTKEDEVVGAVPGFDNVQPLVDFAAQRRLAEVAAEEDGLGRLAEFGEGLSRDWGSGCGTGFGQRFFAANDALPKVAAAA